MAMMKMEYTTTAKMTVEPEAIVSGIVR